jgi:succinate--hydroxymethylglutarate CoA-transferase
LEVLQDSGIPYGPVNNISQTFAHPQVLHREMVKEVEHPTLGTIKLIGPAVKYSETPTAIRTPPPRLGEHTQEVLRDVCEFNQDEIIHLIKKGVVFDGRI